MQTITIVDYGIGNIGSVVNALNYLDCKSIVASDPDFVAKADALLLPGVGSFRKAMDLLEQRGLDAALIHAVRERGKKVLGICLGMQLMGTSSTEDGETIGLGLIPAPVERFSTPEVKGAKIPHVGFNTVKAHADSKLMAGLPTNSDFYFVHSYRILADIEIGHVSTCNYGIPFMAAYEHENVFATQFHPEKSQANGLLLLRNFISQP